MLSPRLSLNPNLVRINVLWEWDRGSLEAEATELARRVSILETIAENGLIPADDPDLVRGLITWKTALAEVNHRRLEYSADED